MEQQLGVKIKEFKNAKKGDLLGYDGRNWVPVDIEQVLHQVRQQIIMLQNKIEEAEHGYKITLKKIEEAVNQEREAIAKLLKGE
jgi:hypothetical protein